MKSTVSLLLFYFISILLLSSPTSSEEDCFYTKCVWKFDHEGVHTPSTRIREYLLVRSVDCTDGNTFHIYCKMPIREDIQKSRQSCFRRVTSVGRWFSRQCTKRVLCEQSCLDGQSGSVRSDYPQVLDSDTEENRDYVSAYSQGEMIACYRKPDQPKGFLKKAQAKLESFIALFKPDPNNLCVQSCGEKYPDCLQEMDNQFLPFIFYTTARCFHKLGMFTFSASHLALDAFRFGEKIFYQYPKQKLIIAGQTIKRAYSDIQWRMRSLESGFIEWALRKQRLLRSVDSDEEEQKWKQFLEVYNQTDPDLIEILYESMNLVQFRDAIRVINHTLGSYDFGPDNWINSSSLTQNRTDAFVESLNHTQPTVVMNQSKLFTFDSSEITQNQTESSYRTDEVKMKIGFNLATVKIPLQSKRTEIELIQEFLNKFNREKATIIVMAKEDNTKEKWPIDDDDNSGVEPMQFSIIISVMFFVIEFL